MYIYALMSNVYIMCRLHEMIFTSIWESIPSQPTTSSCFFFLISSILSTPSHSSSHDSPSPSSFVGSPPYHASLASSLFLPYPHFAFQMVVANWGSFEWFMDRVCLLGVGLNPRKVDFEGRDGLIRECDRLWEI